MAATSRSPVYLDSKEMGVVLTGLFCFRKTAA
jgi:hypothetical protein